MKHTRTLSLLSLVVASAVFLSGCGFKQPTQSYKTKLEIWGSFDDSDAYGDIIGAYRKINPYVEDITYRKLSADTYKQDLLDALAAGKGPDVFLIRNSWLPDFADKVEAAPEYITDERSFRETFVDVVADDFLGPDRKIYGAPLSVNSLALYYNKDLFNAAGITTPPRTWDEFSEDVRKLSKIDAFGNIVQSGAAFGTSYNINRSTDILTALLFQRGLSFWDPVSHDVQLTGQPEGVADFYTRFASIQSPVYTWNPGMHYSVDAFYETRTAMMINYSWQHSTLKRKNAKLNFGVAPLPQFSDGKPANAANYWGFVVSKNKAFDSSVSDPNTQNKLRIHEAWQLLKYLTFPNKGTVTLRNGLTGATKDFPMPIDPAKQYLIDTQQPAARRDLLELQKNDPILGPFVEGNLIAKSWYQRNPEAIEGALAEAIHSINTGRGTIRAALEVAQSRINQIMRK